MKIYLGADHAGYELKNQLFEHLVHKGYEVEDVGAGTLDQADDFPRYAYDVAVKVLGGEDKDDDRGILICGSGQGVAMAANRVRGIRAAVIWNEAGAKETRQDNNSNVLSLPARMIDQETAFAIVDTWLTTKFSGAERHQRRIDQIEELYG
ncbi:MAG TPA: RpiB/LacA/LacB family sugar-phosphate isomerase [Candidatus Saccharimonadales bacterium]|nr:RpiB/LacA/LacB family sugar-phosphate isomerase [Candidatus Saccharimonadales bacterium]